MEDLEQKTIDENAAKLLRAQLYIQNNLDQNLSLDFVSKVVGISPFHFHRLFKAEIGETLKHYVDRLRLEKSIYDMKISDLNLLQISLRYGFKNPETYSRVFRRHFGMSPSSFFPRHKETSMDEKNIVKQNSNGFRNSKDSNFSVSNVSANHLAFIRHIGPYENVPRVADQGNSLWRELESFVKERNLAKPPYLYLGIPQDSPSTEAKKQRFDACIWIERPFQSKSKIGYQRLNSGYYGVLTHAGSYSTLPDAYKSLFSYAKNLKGYHIRVAPVFELLIDISVKTNNDCTWTELYLPLEKK